MLEDGFLREEGPGNVILAGEEMRPQQFHQVKSGIGR
jgi:hypothetical protein